MMANSSGSMGGESPEFAIVDCSDSSIAAVENIASTVQLWSFGYCLVTRNSTCAGDVDAEAPVEDDFEG